MNHYAITMPQLSDTMTEGVVVTWEKQPGDRVERGDIVATVETDKAIMDVEVFKAGYLAGPLADVGATIAVGAALGYITDTAGDVAIAADEVVEEKAQTEMIPHHAGTPIVMPQLSDTMTEGVVVTWEKQPGDVVKRGDIVATVETDKAIMDVEVFRDGYLSGPLAAMDSTVPVGEAIAYLVASKEDVQEEGAAAPQATAEDKQPASDSTQAEEESRTEAAAEASPSAGAPEGAIYTIAMQQLSDTMTEGVVVSWEKQPGDKIKRGTVVAQVETDKAIMDVEVFREGYLSGPMAAVDSTVAVGEPMAYLVESPEQVVREEMKVSGAAAAPAQAEASASPTRKTAPAAPVPAGSLNTGGAPAPRPSGRAATPYARKLAGQRGIDLNTVSGSGPRGAIQAQDVMGAQPMASGGGIREVDVPGNGRPMNKLEAAISQAMTDSLTMPTFRVTAHIRLGALIKAAKAQGVSVTVAIAKACALAMAKYPKMNWCYQPKNKLVERSNVDVGMAVAADGGGLVVPVLRNC
ncbi:MAG TPA: biotin/lipoyl-containing protein, partial [Arenimonas sp.]